MDDDYERIISVKNEVFVYKIPPRQSSRAYRAADWKLDQPDWTGRMRIVLLNKQLVLKLEDKTSGELFAQAPIEKYPGPSVESVADSSRYFVIKVVDVSGRHAFIGIGFADRGDSFDFNVSLQDHFKREKVVDDITTTEDKSKHLDLGFKEGETIKINIGSKSGQEAKTRLKKHSGGNLGGALLPPPPGGVLLPPPPSGASPRMVHQPVTQPVQQPPPQAANTDWGDFTSFSNSSSTESTGWVQF